MKRDRSQPGQEGPLLFLAEKDIMNEPKLRWGIQETRNGAGANQSLTLKFFPGEVITAAALPSEIEE